MTRREDNNVLESRRNELVNEIDQLEKELKQREEQLPAHSIRPHQILPIEKLEEKIRQKIIPVTLLSSGSRFEGTRH